MVAHMKTTIDLPDGLFERLKKTAREHNVPMRQVIIDGLTSEIERRNTQQPPPDFFFPSVAGSGLNPDLDPQSVIANSYDLPSPEPPA